MHDLFETLEQSITQLKNKEDEADFARMLKGTAEELVKNQLLTRRFVEQFVLPQNPHEPRAYVGARPSASDPAGMYRKKRGFQLLKALDSIGAVPMLSSRPSEWRDGVCMHTQLLNQLQAHAGETTTMAGAVVSFPVNVTLSDGTHVWYVDRVHMRKTPRANMRISGQGTVYRNVVLELPAPGSLTPLVCGSTCRRDDELNVLVQSTQRPAFVS